MTKIDLDNQEVRQELKREIMEELKHDARRKRLSRGLGCFLLALLLVAVPVLYVSSLLARTGLVEVPLMTSWLYRSSEPVRTVVPLAGSKTSEILIAEATRAKYDRNFGTFKISLSEAQLTTIAQEGLAVAGNTLPLEIDTVQIAVDNDAVELFVTSPRNGRDVTIRLRFMPTVDGGEIKITPKELRIGALEIPPGVSSALVPLLDRAIGKTLTEGISNIGQVVAIQTEKRVISFQIVPKNSIR